MPVRIGRIGAQIMYGEVAMSFVITGIYASLLTLLLMVLGARVSILRLNTGISLLDGGNKPLAERMRQHANLAESLPMAILLMGIAEVQGASSTYLHAMGLILLVSRLVHPFGISHDNGKLIARPLAATGTAVALLMGIGFILWRAWETMAAVPAS